MTKVEGCAADIAGEKLYYRRYQICEQHLKRLALLVDGVPQRFCQQCARLQLETDFDGVKRSCREKLKSHANRRKNQQPRAKRPARTAPGHELQQGSQDDEGTDRTVSDPDTDAMQSSSSGAARRRPQLEALKPSRAAAAAAAAANPAPGSPAGLSRLASALGGRDRLGAAGAAAASQAAGPPRAAARSGSGNSRRSRRASETAASGGGTLQGGSEGVLGLLPAGTVAAAGPLPADALTGSARAPGGPLLLLLQHQQQQQQLGQGGQQQQQLSTQLADGLLTQQLLALTAMQQAAATAAAASPDAGLASIHTLGGRTLGGLGSKLPAMAPALLGLAPSGLGQLPHGAASGGAGAGGTGAAGDWPAWPVQRRRRLGHATGSAPAFAWGGGGGGTAGLGLPLSGSLGSPTAGLGIPARLVQQPGGKAATQLSRASSLPSAASSLMTGPQADGAPHTTLLQQHIAALGAGGFALQQGPNVRLLSQLAQMGRMQAAPSASRPGGQYGNPSVQQVIEELEQQLQVEGSWAAPRRLQQQQQQQQHGQEQKTDEEEDDVHGERRLLGHWKDEQQMRRQLQQLQQRELQAAGLAQLVKQEEDDASMLELQLHFAAGRGRGSGRRWLGAGSSMQPLVLGEAEAAAAAAAAAAAGAAAATAAAAGPAALAMAGSGSDTGAAAASGEGRGPMDGLSFGQAGIMGLDSLVLWGGAGGAGHGSSLQPEPQHQGQGAPYESAYAYGYDIIVGASTSGGGRGAGGAPRAHPHARPRSLPTASHMPHANAGNTHGFVAHHAGGLALQPLAHGHAPAARPLLRDLLPLPPQPPAGNLPGGFVPVGPPPWELLAAEAAAAEAAAGSGDTSTAMDIGDAPPGQPFGQQQRPATRF